MAKKNKAVSIKKSSFQNEWIMLLPVLFIVTVFLFCIRVQVAPTNLDGFLWYGGGPYVGDVFGYFRLKVLMIVTGVSCLFMLYYGLNGKMKFRKHMVFIPVAVYAVLVLISYAFAEYKPLALWGAEERYEGTIALICYMIMLIYGMHSVKSEKGVHLVVKCFAIACCILGIWGTLETTLGLKFYSLPDWLYIPAELRTSAELEDRMATGVTWFFTNQNYVSFFMVFPICLFGMTCISAEDTKRKVIYAVLTGLMLFNLWQAASLGGMVGLAAAVVVAVFIAGFENIKKWRKSLGMLLLAAVISIGASLPVVMREVQSGAKTDTSMQIDAEEELRFAEIDYIITEGADFIFCFEGEEFRFETENGDIKRIMDGTGTEVAAENELFTTSSFLHEETGLQVMEVTTSGCVWDFVIQQGECFFINPQGNCIKLNKVEKIGFEGKEGFATNRGYIWSRTFPLLKDTILFGHGAGTYPAYFPHDDYAGRYNIGYHANYQDVVFTKPHNMYLGTAVETGVVSLVALLAVYAIYMIESIKIYRKHTFTGFKDYIGMGVCIAMAGFLVAGIVNDTMVQMMPVVYVILGMGFAINRMLKEEKKAE